MITILISGKSGSGKDTLANFMKQELEAEGKRVLIIHFADPVKWIAAAYFNWNGQKDQVGRSLLQFLGTDCVRKYDENFWADFVGRFIRVMREADNFDYAIVPDARFVNEIDRVCLLNYGAKLIRIDRYNPDGSAWSNPLLTEEQRQHASETSLDNYRYFDYRIRNDSSEDNLKAKVPELLDYMRN